MTKEWTDKFTAAYEQLGSLGERVLGFAYRCVRRFLSVSLAVSVLLCGVFALIVSSLLCVRVCHTLSGSVTLLPAAPSGQGPPAFTICAHS